MVIKGTYIVVNEKTGSVVGEAFDVDSSSPAHDAMRNFAKELKDEDCALYVRVGQQRSRQRTE